MSLLPTYQNLSNCHIQPQNFPIILVFSHHSDNTKLPLFGAKVPNLVRQNICPQTLKGWGDGIVQSAWGENVPNGGKCTGQDAGMGKGRWQMCRKHRGPGHGNGGRVVENDCIIGGAYEMVALNQNDCFNKDWKCDCTCSRRPGDIIGCHLFF